MNKDHPYLHYDSENSYSFHLYMVLIPLILYGFYKNGILPFLNHDITLLQILRPILFPIVGYGIGLLVDYLIWWQGSKRKIWTNCPLYGVLITMTLPIHANLFLVAVLLFFSLYAFRMLEKTKRKISNLFATKVIFIILFTFLGKVSFSNATELNHTVIYSLLDIFFGRGIGGICSTSIFWMFLAFIYMWFDYYYKKEIPLYAIGAFVITSFLFEIIFPTGDFLKFILNPSILFACIFFAPEITSSPYTQTAMSFYGITIGILGFILTRFLNEREGIYLSIFLISIFVPWLDQFAYKIEKKKAEVLSNAIF